ncbi:MAG: Rrf2 family transcriptional regulator [Pseudobdellovibrio sp.]
MVNQQFATAVHILTALAFSKKKLLNSEVLAASVSTNPVVIRRLLSLLTKAELVVTLRGKSGGVHLAKDPNQITLKDVYVAINLSESICAHTKKQTKECPVSCSMQAILATISDGTQKSILKYLDSQKLSDIIKKIPKQ